MGGNRDVNNIRRIKRSIEKVGQVLAPILVNEKMQIVDGQHRLEAFKEMGLPVPYIIQKGAGIDECRAMNVAMTNWTTKNFIQSYSDEGILSYQYLDILVKRFTGKIGVEGVIYTCSPDGCPATGGSNYLPIKEGRFVLTEKEYFEAEKRLDGMTALGFVDFMKKHEMHQRTFVPAVVYAFQHPDVSPEKLMKALNRNPMNVIRCSSIEDQLRNFDELYNYKVKARDRVYMEADFKRRLYLQENE